MYGKPPRNPPLFSKYDLLMKNLTDTDFESEVLESPIPTLVDFGAAMCSPCKTLGATLNGMVDEYKGKVKFCHADIQKAPGTAQRFGVHTVPCASTLFGPS